MGGFKECLGTGVKTVTPIQCMEAMKIWNTGLISVEAINEDDCIRMAYCNL
jgi:hypothetical protein